MSTTEYVSKVYEINSKNLLEEADGKDNLGMQVYHKILNTAEHLKLKQIVPICDEEGTKKLLAIHEQDTNLIKCTIIMDDDPELEYTLYLTAPQIKLINDLGTMKYNAVKYEVNEIIPCFDCESDNLHCEIYLTLEK